MKLGKKIISVLAVAAMMTAAAAMAEVLLQIQALLLLLEGITRFTTLEYASFLNMKHLIPQQKDFKMPLQKNLVRVMLSLIYKMHRVSLLTAPPYATDL